MVYKRPKYVKANRTNEITGPWLDTEFFTDSIKSESCLSIDGDNDSILKNSLVNLWDSITVEEVRYQRKLGAHPWVFPPHTIAYVKVSAFSAMM